MNNYDDITNESIKWYNINLSWILDNPCRIIITRVYGSLKSNALLNFIKQQDDDNFSAIDKIYAYVKCPIEAKYQYFIEKCKKVVLNNFKIQRLVLNIQIIECVSIKSTTQAENVMY